MFKQSIVENFKDIKDSALANVRDAALEFVIAVLIFLSVYNGVFRTAIISGESMEPTFSDSQRCVVWVSAYWFKEPKRGDVIVFPSPGDKKSKYIKRVAAKSGDEVDFKNGAFYVNGEKLKNGETSFIGSYSLPLIVPDDTVFALGDNIDASRDSRDSSVGCIAQQDIVGKVVFRFWPFKKAGVIN
ncbi:MAG: signal peptidase I [Clostridiales bacterium]|nr:signal peptidase I [Clostridiales bacterium]